MKNYSIESATANNWLRSFAKVNLPKLRNQKFETADYADEVTIVGYFFYGGVPDFDGLEFSLLHTMRTIGKMPIVLVVNKICDQVKRFQECHDNVRIEIEPSLIPGGTETMSYDCIHMLYRRFDTAYCLVVQNDGFPLRRGLGEFLNRYDYIGAPIFWRSALANVEYLRSKFVLNGGFSLRSRKYCEFVSRYAPKWNETEDWTYSLSCLRHPIAAFRSRLSVAPKSIAARFSMIDLMGKIDVGDIDTFGVHGATAIWQRRQNLVQFGYKI